MQAGPAAALTFSGMLLARLASADAGDAAGENVVQSLALWPSVSGKPGATVSSSSPAAASCGIRSNLFAARLGLSCTVQ